MGGGQVRSSLVLVLLMLAQLRYRLRIARTRLALADRRHDLFFVSSKPHTARSPPAHPPGSPRAHAQSNQRDDARRATHQPLCADLSRSRST